MSTSADKSRERPALTEFVEAVLEVSDDPTRLNVERYLEASRALDAAPPARRAKQPRDSRHGSRR